MKDIEDVVREEMGLSPGTSVKVTAHWIPCTRRALAESDRPLRLRRLEWLRFRRKGRGGLDLEPPGRNIRELIDAFLLYGMEEASEARTAQSR